LRYTPESGRTIAGSDAASLWNRHQFNGQFNRGSVCLHQPVPREISLASNRHAMLSDGQT